LYAAPRWAEWQKEVAAMTNLIYAAFGSLLLGFALGLFSFKIKSRWCPECGAWTHRQQPPHTHRLAGPR